MTHGWLRAGITLDAAEVIPVPKRGESLRPVLALDITSRVLFRALLDALAPMLPVLDRSYEQRDAAQRAPLAIEGTTHVVIGDIAAFYDQIDHGLLQAELVAETGEAEIAETLAETLGAIMGRNFGLPQVYRPSDVLSDVFIDTVERRLIRAELAVSRFADDFWIAAANWRQGNESLEILSRELRRLGLFLSDRKSRVLTAETYAEWLSAPERRWAAITDEVDIDLRRVGLYADDAEKPEGEDDILERAGHRALQYALERADDDRLQTEVKRQLAGAALSLLQALPSSVGLPLTRDVLHRFPDVAGSTARYLQSVVPTDNDGVRGAYEALIEDRGLYLSDWQALWLVEPLRDLPDLSPPIAHWLATLVHDDRPGYLRARSAIALAEKDMIDDATLMRLYGLADHATRPELVVAIASKPDVAPRVLAAAQRDSALHRWIVDDLRP